MPKYNVYATQNVEYIFEFECNSLDESEVIEAAQEFLKEKSLSEIGEITDSSTEVWSAEPEYISDNQNDNF